MRYLPSLLFVLLIFIGCSNQNEAAYSTDSKSKNTYDVNEVVVSFEQTACFGTCPVHKMEIYGRGNAKYHGDRNVKFEGDFIANVSPKQLAEIIDKANAINFFELEAEYTAPVTDLPTSIIYIKDGNKKHQVKAYAEYPKELADYIKYLYEVSQKIDWQKNQ